MAAFRPRNFRWCHTLVLCFLIAVFFGAVARDIHVKSRRGKEFTPSAFAFCSFFGFFALLFTIGSWLEKVEITEETIDWSEGGGEYEPYVRHWVAWRHIRKLVYEEPGRDLVAGFEDLRGAYHPLPFVTPELSEVIIARTRPYVED